MKFNYLFIILFLAFSCGKSVEEIIPQEDPKLQNIGIERDFELSVYDVSNNGPIAPSSSEIGKFSFIWGKTNKESPDINKFSSYTFEVYAVRDIGHGKLGFRGGQESSSALFFTTIGNPDDTYFVDLGEGDCEKLSDGEKNHKTIQKEYFDAFQNRGIKIKVVQGHCYFYHSFELNTSYEGTLYVEEIFRLDSDGKIWISNFDLEFLLEGPDYKIPLIKNEFIKIKKAKLLYLKRDYNFWKDFENWPTRKENKK